MDVERKHWEPTNQNHRTIAAIDTPLELTNRIV